MGSLLSSEGNRWLSGIVLVAIGAGITAKNITSYPTEYLPNSTPKISDPLLRLLQMRHFAGIIGPVEAQDCQLLIHNS